MSSNLPPPDPAEGHSRFMEAEGKRSQATTSLSDGSLTLEELFSEEEAEDGTALGHMHLRHALIALPHIGETKADEIIEGLGLHGDRHLDTIGSDQRRALIQEVADHSPRSAT